MADWVRNKLIINGSTKAIKRLFNAMEDALTKQQIDLLNWFKLPENAPQEYAALPSDFKADPDLKDWPHWYQAHWYDYNVKHFGCKWTNLELISYQLEQRRLVIEFNSPWSPLNEDCLNNLSLHYRVNVENHYYDCDAYRYYGITIKQLWHCVKNYHRGWDLDVYEDEDDQSRIDQLIGCFDQAHQNLIDDAFEEYHLNKCKKSWC